MPNQIKIVATGYNNKFVAVDNPGYIINRDGTVTNRNGIENVVAIDNVGIVTRHSNQWVSMDNTEDKSLRIVPYEDCSCHSAFEMIGDRQVSALRRLLADLLTKFRISFVYDNQLGRICPRAVAGESGIFFASSFDRQRHDIHPQIEILNIIKSLAQ